MRVKQADKKVSFVRCKCRLPHSLSPLKPKPYTVDGGLPKGTDYLDSTKPSTFVVYIPILRVPEDPERLRATDVILSPKVYTKIRQALQYRPPKMVDGQFGGARKTLNPKTLNPQALDPKTLNPKTLNPKTLSPKTLTLKP